MKATISRFIKEKLHLKVNKEKTIASYVKGVKFLGYSFYVLKGKCNLGKIYLIVPNPQFSLSERKIAYKL